jgi:hypothetical protein
MTPNECYHKYQKGNKKYRKYRRKFEKRYREKNRIMWNLKSWKCMQRTYGKRVTEGKEFVYLLDRLLKQELMRK